MSAPSRSPASLLGPIPVYMVLGLLTLLFGSLLPVGRPSPSTAPVVTERPATTQEIKPTLDPARFRAVDLCLAGDDSNSEYGQRGSDPSGERYAAARQMLDYLVGLPTPENAHKIAVVKFGSTTQARLPLTAISDSGVDVIRTALQPSDQPLGATNFPEAIRVCRQMLAGAANPIIVVVSDGDPDLEDRRPVSALFADIATTVADLGGVPVHVLLTIRGGVAPSTMAQWRATGIHSATDVGGGEQLRQLVARKLIDILGGAIGVLPHPLGTLDAEHTTLTLEVPAYAPLMTLASFTKAGSATVRLRDPSGAIVSTESKRIAIISVAHPAPGPWRVEIVDGGPADIQVDIAPLQARLLTPLGRVPVAVGRPLTVSARVGDGAPLPPALYVGAVVEAAGKFYDLELKPDQSDIWHSVDAAPITQEGPVKVRLLLKSGPDTVLDSSSGQFTAARTPYLVPDPLVVLAGDGAHYGWRLHQNGEPASDRLLGEAPRAAVTVQIGAGPAQQATYQGDGYWTIPASSLRTGQKLDATLSSRLPDGTEVLDRVTSTPVVVQPALWVRTYRALTFASAALGLMTVAWLVWLFLLVRRPLDGYLRRPASSGTSNPLRVRSLRWVRTGMTPDRSGRVVWLQRGTLIERIGLFPWPFDSRLSDFTFVPSRQPTGSAQTATMRTVAPRRSHRD